MHNFPTEWYPIITGIEGAADGQIVLRREFELGIEWTTPLDRRQPVDRLVFTSLALMEMN